MDAMGLDSHIAKEFLATLLMTRRLFARHDRLVFGLRKPGS